MTLEEKYKYAIKMLERIAKTQGDPTEWNQTESFIECRNIARTALTTLGEKKY